MGQKLGTSMGLPQRREGRAREAGTSGREKDIDRGAGSRQGKALLAGRSCPCMHTGGRALWQLS